jgi:hypothetical protein
VRRRTFAPYPLAMRSACHTAGEIAFAIVLPLFALIITGCGVFELAPSGLECQRMPAGGRDLSEGRDPLAEDGPLAGLDLGAMSAAEVGNVATEAGLGVTWRFEYDVGEQPESGSVGYAECWCVPPPTGRVSGAAYDSLGRVVVFVDSGEHRANVRPQPELGWGCEPEST